ncbi:phosphate/phosphite/phosphonate ABC transporter substrate-binding protein [Rhodococcus chondri]|uniref:Phosphate/phosphite/phosphonate ABC transporter substrate-binding protein n=1 Tax=Rhodococcus chondri TaxID=3065941 RepID=A0ABU7JTA7_9NOCA|nr:phosphate/phosphite/phosphonate ABC transporter substrate-binding protein [Rhodococcus sp. CC-R104]MEE2033258.1 phosphate/phosphite/phosphonate ABC transporter substrate-binding protein [Rhodococcus sp. CC-R104]
MRITTRRSSRALALTATAAASLLVLTACGSSADDTGSSSSDSSAAAQGMPETLVLAAIPSEDSSSLQQQFALVQKVIEDETGIPVEFQNATDYAAVIEAQRAGKVHLGHYGPFSYVTAKDSGVPVEPLAAFADSADEKPGYKSYAIVPTGSDIRSLEDFRGKTVCFVDPTSTSGFLYPSAGLLEVGIDPQKDVTAIFAGGHDASALAVDSGQCDAGFAFDKMVTQTLIDKGDLAEGDLEVIWESETIASSPTAVLSTLPGELVDQLTDIFHTKLNRPALVEAGYCATEDECALPEGTEFGYIPVSDDIYDGVRKVCEITRSPSCAS